jgi:hypothetical protein
MDVQRLADDSAMAWNGDIHLALLAFLNEHSINFRGADPFEVHRKAVETGIAFEGQPERYKKEKYDAGADGKNWLTHDPDGNNIFFDTNKNEIGEKGSALFFLRALDATRRQLVNIEAPTACRETFESEVVEKFVIPALKQAAGRDLTPLPQPGRFAGFFSYCLKTSDNAASRDWYRALGLAVGTPGEGEFIQMYTSDCDLALMNFLPENWLNFRGADIFRIYDQMTAAGLALEGEPAHYTEEEYGSAGAHWQTKDPDGNVVYFDTTDPERIEPGDGKILRRVLERACSQLEDIEADPVCVDAIRREVIDRFAA